MSGSVKIFGGGSSFEPGVVTTFPANTIPYINGSQQTAYDTTFTYQSSQLGVGIASSLEAKLHIKGANDSTGSALKVQSATYEVINIYNDRKLIIGGGSTVSGTDYIINAFGPGSSSTDVILTINGAGGHNIFRFANSGTSTKGGLEIVRSGAPSLGRNALAIFGNTTNALTITTDGTITWPYQAADADTDASYIQYTSSFTALGTRALVYSTVGSSTGAHIFKRGRNTLPPDVGPIVIVYGNYVDSAVANTSDNSVFRVRPTINLTGTGTKNMIGIHYVPTVTSLTGGGRHFSAVLESGSMVLGTNIAGSNASALLHLSSTTQGFLPPVMTGAQAEAISSPAAGLLVYANNGNGATITSTGWWGYTGSTWVKLN